VQQYSHQVDIAVLVLLALGVAWFIYHRRYAASAPR
jgi:uncharacterized membrane protein YqiK